MLHIEFDVKLWQPIKNDPEDIFISLTKVPNSAVEKRHNFRKLSALGIEVFNVNNKKCASKMIFFNEKKN